jgi:hypothetical protein
MTIMQFKNLVGQDKQVLSDASHLILSDNEFKKYSTGNIEKENTVETPDMDFKVETGIYNLMLNDKEYKVEVLDYDSELYGIKVIVEDRITFVIEKIREINKYDLIRSFIQNLKNLEGE